MEGDDLVQGEARADLVAHHHQVLGVVLEELLPVLEEDAGLILRDVIIDELNGLEGKLGQQVVDEVGELFLIILTHEEDVLDLLDLREAPDVVVDDGVASDREERPRDRDREQEEQV